MKYIKIFLGILFVFSYIKYENSSYYRNQETFKAKNLKAKIWKVESNRDRKYYYSHSEYFNESMVVGIPIEAKDSIIKLSDTVYIKKIKTNYTEKIKRIIKYRKFRFFSL